MKIRDMMENYSVVITYIGGESRGYTALANGRKEAFAKLMEHINFNLIQRVEIAEIVVDKDMIK